MVKVTRPLVVAMMRSTRALVSWVRVTFLEARRFGELLVICFCLEPTNLCGHRAYVVWEVRTVTKVVRECPQIKFARVAKNPWHCLSTCMHVVCHRRKTAPIWFTSSARPRDQVDGKESSAH